MIESLADRFAAAHRGFTDAQARVGRVERTYAIGAFTIRVSFAGPALVPLFDPALAHLASDPSAPPDLTIRAWDTASTGIAAPPPAAPAAEWNAPGAHRGGHDGTVYAVRGPGRDACSLLDAGRDLAVYHVSDAGAVPSYATAAPFLDILHWWMRARGAQVVHAAALGTPAGGVLLVGKGGAGKSTTALACCSTALRHAADDHCLVTMGEPPHLWSLYNAAKVRADHLDRFPILRRSRPERFHDDKAIVTLHPHARAQCIAEFPLRAVLVVRVTDRPDTALRPAPPSAVLHALAPSTVLQLKGADQRDLHCIAELSRRVPGHFLDVGTDLTRIAPPIAALLAGTPTR
jgi:hypothetical protein